MKYKGKKIDHPTLEMVEEFVKKYELDIDARKLFEKCEKKQWLTQRGVKTVSFEAYISSQKEFAEAKKKQNKERKALGLGRIQRDKKKANKKPTVPTKNMPWWDDPELNDCNVITSAPWDNTEERVTKTVERKPLNRQKYSDALQDPRWQKKRLEVFQRDNWSCQLCGNGLNDGVPLNIHHRIYHTGRKPWEYDDKELLTICEKCHTKLHMK